MTTVTGFLSINVTSGRASGFGGMEWWNVTVEWNSGMVEYWNGGKTTPTKCAVSRPFPISFICHGPETSIP